MRCDFSGVVIDEVSDAVMGDAPEFRPAPQRADGRFFVFGEDPATAETDDVCELTLSGSGDLWRFHAPACRSSAASKDMSFQAADRVGFTEGTGSAETGVEGMAACFGMIPKNCSASSVVFKSR